VIAPWNYPFHNMLNHIISGLFAGNAVVSKPSEYTSWSGGYFLRLVREVLVAAGHSPDLVQVVTGFADAGAALVASNVDKIIFTGSPGVRDWSWLVVSYLCRRVPCVGWCLPGHCCHHCYS